MSRADEFLDLYKKLEAVVANTYGSRREGGSVAKLGRRAEFRSISAELDYIRDVRNLLSHRPKISGDYMVEPSEAMIRLLEQVIERVETPAIAENIMVRGADILSCSLDDRILPAIRLMYDRGISHVPILEDRVVTGVFSNSTYIHCTISGEYQLEEETRFSAIERELRLDAHEAEQFFFTERETPIDELSDIFEEAGREGRKAGMIFVTEHGREKEKLLGIITAWDVAGAY